MLRCCWLLQAKALITIIYTNVLLDRQIISEMFITLLTMACQKVAQHNPLRSGSDEARTNAVGTAVSSLEKTPASMTPTGVPGTTE